MARATFRPAFRKMICGLVLLCTALALVVWPQQSMQAARGGLSLCAQTIVPSLLPFFVLSAMVLKLDMARCLGRLLEPVMWPLFRVGGAGAAALVLGFVGGYPVGARTAMELYREGPCSRAETERLLAFCNNSGPAFVLGAVGAGVFGSGRAGLALYAVHMAASVCVGVIFRFYGETERCSVKKKARAEQEVRFSSAFVDSVHTALSAVLNVCAFVVVFSVLICLLDRSGIVDRLARGLMWIGMDVEQVRQLLRGVLEVSSGVSGLRGEGRLAMAAFMLGWAGVSVHCQVLSFLADSGLRVGTYLVGKALHGVLSAMFVVGLEKLLPGMLPAGGWLVQQVEGSRQLGSSGVFGLSVSAAWLLWLAFFAMVMLGKRNAKKRGGKRRTIAV